MATTYYLKSGAGAAEFNAAHTYALHDKIVPTRADVSANVGVARGWVWECTTAGTTNGAASWGATVTQDVTTMTQNGTVFTARKPGFSSGTTADWTFATIYADYLFQASSPLAAGDDVYASKNHAENISTGNITLVSPGTVSAPVRFLCVDDAAAPPTAWATGASITLSANQPITINNTANYIYCYGIAFVSSFNGSGATISTGGSNSSVTYCEKCQFEIFGNGSGSIIRTGNGSTLNFTEWRFCDVRFGHAAQTVQICGEFYWCCGTLLSGGTSPTNLLSAGVVFRAIIDDLDLANASAGINFINFAGSTGAYSLKIREGKPPASWSGAFNAGVPGPGIEIDGYVIDNAGTNYKTYRSRQFGTVVPETTIVRAGGASNGTTPLSWKMTMAATVGVFPIGYLETSEIPIWVNTTGAAVTVGIEIIRDNATALTNANIWPEVIYLGSSSSSLGSLASGRVADSFATATAWAASSASWTNSMSNPNPQTLSVSFTPQLKGPYLIRIRWVGAANDVLYLDPKPSVTSGGVPVVQSILQYQIPGGLFINEGYATKGSALVVTSAGVY